MPDAGRTLLAGLAAVAALATAGAALARVETPAEVRFFTQHGRSKYAKVTVTFAMGAELDTVAKTSQYDRNTAYALIFLPDDKVVVIEESGVPTCHDEFTAACLSRFGTFVGVDQTGRKWEVCTESFCFD